MPTLSRRLPARRTVVAVVGFLVIVVAIDAAIIGAVLAQETGARVPGSSAPPGRSPGVPSGGGPAVTPTAAPTGPTVVLVGAGDISSCANDHDTETAALIEGSPGIVFTAGDNAYDRGTGAEFRKCYAPTWGRFKDRTRPTIGNHDVVTASGQPYFDYFGAAAGSAPDGWYSYTAGTWHVVVLNSNCSLVGCGEGSRQLAWLRDDLAAHPAACTLAIWHHPRFSSGEHGSNALTGPFWQTLYDAGADLIVNGHDHDYERFAPQTPSGALDPARGLREIIVGTGGKSLRLFNRIVANSEVRNASTYGVLQLRLEPGAYSWQFLGVGGRSFSDSGSNVCH